LGAVCDNFLSSNQEILTEAEWQALIAQWLSQGLSLECTNSQAVADYKDEIEKLCSKTPCSYELKQALKGLKKILKTGDKMRAIPVLTDGLR
jgi:hypothetical protein